MPTFPSRIASHITVRDLTQDRLPNCRTRDIMRWMDQHQVADGEIVLALGSKGVTFNVLRRCDRKNYECVCTDWSAAGALRAASIFVGG